MWWELLEGTIAVGANTTKTLSDSERKIADIVSANATIQVSITATAAGEAVIYIAPCLKDWDTKGTIELTMPLEVGSNIRTFYVEKGRFRRLRPHAIYNNSGGSITVEWVVVHDE